MGRKTNLKEQLKSALITGGNGFVGRAIVHQLLEAGVACRVIGRNPYPELEKSGVECVVGDICDQQIMQQAAEGVDIVFHVAALAGIWGAWEAYHRINVLGTESVIKACRGRVKYLVYTSTPSVVFNRDSIENGDETLPYPDKFLCHYARSKVAAEKMVLEANGDQLLTCAIRPHLVWGPGDPHLIPRLVEARLKGRLKVVGNKDNMVDISYVDNVAHAHLLAAENLVTTGTAAGKPYFIGQEKPVNLWQWLDDLFEDLDVPRLNAQVPFKVAYVIGGLLEFVYKILGKQEEPPMTRFVAEQLAKSHYFSHKNAQKDLGYEPIVSTEEGVKRLVASFKSSHR